MNQITDSIAATIERLRLARAQEFAALLNGRQYGAEITQAEKSQAEAAGLVVVFGYSDDNCELRGAINDEISCYDGGSFFVSERGVHMEPDRDEEDTLKRFHVLELVQKCGRKIEAQWCKVEGYSWTYATEIPHATFEIVEGEEKFCRGIVFAIADVKIP